MDKHLFQAVSLSQLQKPEDMGHVAVYASVGYQSHQMKRGIILLTVLNSCKELFVLEEIAVLDCFRDSGQLLIYNAACAHVQVSDLRVSHLAVGKSHGQPAGISLYKGAFLHQPVHHRGIGLQDRISPLFLI